MRYESLTADHIEGLKQLWIEEWGASIPMREQLLVQNVLNDANLLDAGTRVAIDESTGQITGYVVAKLWQDRIGGLDYDFHKRVFPGVPAANEDAAVWLEKRGYTRQSEIFDLYRDYEAGQLEPLPEQEQVRFRLLTAEEAPNFNAFMQRCFPGWYYQTLHYWQMGGDGREFVVCEKEGDIIGFCRINDSKSPLLAQNVYWSPLFEEELGGIGPLGIDERHRGHGYGIDIVKAGVHFLQMRGIRNMVIDTTPYVEFYGKLGFETWRRYIRYRKSL